MARMTIGKLAKAANVPVSTLRYYERRGLIRPSLRTSGNYRVFDDDAAERVRFIRAAQANGFTLDDVEGLLRFADGELAPCGEVRLLIESRLESVRGQMRELRLLKDTLKGALDQCLAADPAAPCEVVDELRRKSGKSDRRKKN